MSATKVDITLEKGATFERIIYWLDSDGSAKDLSGYTVRMKIRHTKTGTIIADSSSGLISINTDNLASGYITVTINAANTDKMDFIRGVYDIEFNDGSDVKTRLLEGNVIFSKGVTW